VITRLATNAYDIGFADIGAVIEFAARNPGQAPLATLVLYDRSPLAVVALKKSGIAKPADIVGKVIGAAAAGHHPRAGLHGSDRPAGIGLHPSSQRVR